MSGCHFCVGTEEEVNQRQVQRLVRIEEKVQNQEDKTKKTNHILFCKSH